MKIIGVSNLYNEADILYSILQNLAYQGVDEIITTDSMSDDGTRDILAECPIYCRVLDDMNEFHEQEKLMNLVANMAVEAAADWILPFDGDEFWDSALHPTIRETLEHCETPVVAATCYQYFDTTRREPEPKQFPKVAFRPLGPFHLAMGSHWVHMDRYTGPPATGHLNVREVQFRGFDHFVWKVKQRTAAFPPEVPQGSGAHVRAWAAMSDEELQAEWERMNAAATEYDPIPVRLPPWRP